jgi:hypothetical protein
MACSVVRRIVGNVRTARATPPAIAEKCPVERTTTANAKTPQMIEGTPVKSLAMNRTVLANLERRLYSQI